MTIFNYSTKQKGYGRQGLYLDILDGDQLHKNIYIRDVFPNIREHFDFVLDEDASYNEEGDYFTDGNGNGRHKTTFSSTIEALSHFIDEEQLIDILSNYDD